MGCSPRAMTALVPCFQVEFAAVDCTQETGVCGANDVRGYPTLKYYNYFKTSRPYDGGRTVRGAGGGRLLFTGRVGRLSAEWCRTEAETPVSCRLSLVGTSPDL